MERSYGVLEAKASYKDTMDFKLIRNDITNMKVDAIVLPANKQLKVGSGSSKAIFEKAGQKELEEACKKITNTYVGGAFPTVAFNLDAKYIIHTVVPKWKGGKQQEYELLSAAYISALEITDVMGCESIAFPLLSSGNNGFDIELAFRIAEESIQSFVAKKDLKKIFLVLYDVNSVNAARKQGYEVSEYIDEIYVQNKDEKHTTIPEKALKQGLEFAQNWFSTPENREKAVQAGIEIALKILKKTKK